MHSSDHRSRFTVLSETETLTDSTYLLAGAASEYLFYKGFWVELNAQFPELQDPFDQYEETTAPPAVISAILTKLQAVIEQSKSEPEEISFVRGWSANGEPIETRGTRQDFVIELGKLAEFLQKALEETATIECSL